MKRVLMIQPPQWCPQSPYLAIPLLGAQLKKAGFETKIIDLNIKFFNKILNSQVLTQSDISARKDLSALEKKYANTDFNGLKEHGTYAQKSSALKYLSLKEFYANHEKEIPEVIDSIDLAVSIMKNSELFYNPERLSWAKRIITVALQIASLPFAPNELSLYNYYMHPAFELKWDCVKQMLADTETNMFYNYMREFAYSCQNESYDIICVSFTDLCQFIAVFTLTHFLKQYTKAKVIIGGNYITQISQDILQYEEIFRDYVDFISIGNGETALPMLCKALAEHSSLDNVPNTIFYSQEKRRIINTGFSCSQFDMNALSFADFSDYDFSEYYSPEIIFPVELSKGCYWGKCTFCDYAYGHQQYSPKVIPRIIDELRYYVENYGVNKFVFVDECIPPAFYNRLASAIIESGLQIYYYSFARLENGFTKEVLKNLYQSGARLLLWGYEAASERVMKLMNKGIDVENRLKILRDSRDVGIWNNGLFLLGYPTETVDEILETMQVAYQHRREIPSCSFSDFKMKKHSELSKRVGKEGINSLDNSEELYVTYNDISDGLGTVERRTLRRKLQHDFLEQNIHSLWPVIASDFDHLFLYLSKYGCDYVSGYRSENRIAPEFR